MTAACSETVQSRRGRQTDRFAVLRDTWPLAAFPWIRSWYLKKNFFMFWKLITEKTILEPTNRGRNKRRDCLAHESVAEQIAG